MQSTVAVNVMEKCSSALAFWSRLRTVIYACLLIKLTKPHIAYPLIYSTKQSKSSRTKSCIRATQTSINNLYSKAGVSEECEIDINSVVLVNYKLAITCGLISGQWYQALFSQECSEKSDTGNRFTKNSNTGNYRSWMKCKRWIKIVICSNVKDDVCLLSSVLYHNVLQSGGFENGLVYAEFGCSAIPEFSEPVQRIITLWDNIHGSERGSDTRNLLNTTPDITSEVHVQAVESPNYRCGVELEPMLKEYFRVPKIVAVGDVIVLAVPQHKAHEFTPASSIIPPKHVFIKVTQVKGQSGSEVSRCVQVAVGSTDLFLSGTTHCLLPIISENFDDEGEINAPPILKHTAVKVKTILQVGLHDKQLAPHSPVNRTVKSIRGQRIRNVASQSIAQLKAKKIPQEDMQDRSPQSPKQTGRHNTSTTQNNTATILLLGCEGSGKKEVIKLAATSLGMGVVWVNCWTLKGDTSGGTEARVRQTFVRAAAVGPCVLALLNVHCISRDRDGGDDVRVVSTLREEVTKLSQLEPKVFLLATAPHRNALSDDLWSLWSHQEGIEVPDPTQRAVMLTWFLSLTPHSPSLLNHLQFSTTSQIPFTSHSQSSHKISRNLNSGSSQRSITPDILQNSYDQHAYDRSPHNQNRLLKSNSPQTFNKLESPKAPESQDTPQVQSLAQRTAGYTLGDFQALMNAAQRHRLLRLSEESLESRETEEDTDVKFNKAVSLTHTDLLKALDEVQGSRSVALGAPRIPQVKWTEVGGLEEAKREIVNTIQLPLKHPALVSSKLRRSGVLLYGPPGTGKTLLAKAVATECGLNFMSVKGPELLNMYVGQSEENVRQVFSRAKSAAPCVIFFDELDSLAPSRGRSGDSGGVMDRIVSALLAELDGVASGADVFVLAATNRPDLLDPALLRPGRFEKLVFLGVCEDKPGQVKILKAVTSKMPLAPSVSLHSIAELLPLTLTGADLHALCSDALYSALRRTINQNQAKKGEDEEVQLEEQFEIEEDDFNNAVKNLVPSVTPRELLHYRSLEKQTRR